MSTFDLLLVDAHVATMDEGYGVIRDAAVGIRDDRIAWVGPRRDLPRDAHAAATLSCAGDWLMPGLVDCHTHLVYAGNRANEFERRLNGATYADIAREGGGIASTVRATRAASEADLARQSMPRLASLASEGVTTVEIKSGYGLDTANEAKQLRVARGLAAEAGVDVRTTLLAAHALPPEYAGRADDYVDYVCRDTIPAIAREGLADAVDAFCESIAFTRAQTQRVFEAAHAHGLPVKLHADQLSDMDGARLAAESGALSADHIEYTSDAGIAAMAASGTVAVLLPGAFYALRETKVPPIAALRAARVPIAISTDCNPGTSPVTSLVLMINMACTVFRLTPEEALRGMTQHAARALDLRDRGTLAPGRRADFVAWNVEHPNELSYWFGHNPCARVVVGGRPRGEIE